MPPNWVEIGAAVRARRLELGLTQKQAADAADISLPVWNVLENGRQKGFEDLTYRRVARALSWSADSFDRLQKGQPPRLLGPQPLDLSRMDANDLARLLEEAAARLRGTEEQHRDSEC